MGDVCNGVGTCARSGVCPFALCVCVHLLSCFRAKSFDVF